MRTFLTAYAAIAGLMLFPGQAPSLTVSMLDHAQISGDQILLSHLAPSGVSAEDLSRCGAVAFGKSPALGSVRVITKSDITRRLKRCPASLSGMLIPDQVIVSRVGHRISAGAVEKALIRSFPRTNVTGVIALGELSWPVEQEALDPDPALQLTTSSWDAAQQRWQFLLRCSSRKVCSPFLATLRGGPDLFRDAHAPQTQPRRAPTPIVRRGQKALLLIDGGRIRVSLQVTCLQNGAVGEHIRVLDSANHRFLQAEVVAPQLLKAAS